MNIELTEQQRKEALREVLNTTNDTEKHFLLCELLKSKTYEQVINLMVDLKNKIKIRDGVMERVKKEMTITPTQKKLDTSEPRREPRKPYQVTHRKKRTSQEAERLRQEIYNWVVKQNGVTIKQIARHFRLSEPYIYIALKPRMQKLFVSSTLPKKYYGN